MENQALEKSNRDIHGASRNSKPTQHAPPLFIVPFSWPLACIRVGIEILKTNFMKNRARYFYFLSLSLRMALVSLPFFLCASASHASGQDEPNPYEVLGVSKNAPAKEIQRAYRRLAMKYHPDVNKTPDAEVQFMAAARAYEILSDPDSRAAYDRDGVSRPSNSGYRENSRVGADELGGLYSNDRWTYHRGSHRFYDNRTGIWFTFNTTWIRFESSDGWILNLNCGRYHSPSMDGEWNPDDSTGWHRTTYLGNQPTLIPINPKTGFPRSAKYTPRTISDASDLFDESFNPVHVLNERHERGKPRTEILEKLNRLEWTPERTEDFVERALAHIVIFYHPDMRALSPIVGASMKALLDNPEVIKHPQIMTAFVQSISDDDFEYFIGEIFLQEAWLHHPNASQWLTSFFQSKLKTKRFFRQLFARYKSNLAQFRVEFERIHPVLKKAGISRQAIDSLILGLSSHYDVPGFQAFKEILQDFVKQSEFTQLIAHYDSKYSEHMKKFLSWYGEHIDQRTAHVFLHALSMPGVSRSDYYTSPPDGSERVFNQAAYDADRMETANNRIGYIERSLRPQDSAASPQCKGSLRGMGESTKP